MSWPMNEDWYYDQGDDNLVEVEEDEEETICDECGYTNCQCDAADDYYRDMMDDR